MQFGKIREQEKVDNNQINAKMLPMKTAQSEIFEWQKVAKSKSRKIVSGLEAHETLRWNAFYN